MDDWGAATLLLPGDPGSVGQLGNRLLELAGGLLDAGQRIGLIEANQWTGDAATAFVGLRGVHAGAFLGAADSFGQAGVACSAYAKVLAHAQGRAGVAVHLYAEADAATARWQALRIANRAQAKEAARTHDQQVTAPSAVALTTADPGAAGRGRAEAIVAAARQTYGWQPSVPPA